MKLIRLELDNFRQHLHSAIDFEDGVTGVIGSNGAGKTTILEAIAWALYGSPALRGNNDSVRSKAAEGGAKAKVALTFELGGSRYRAERLMDAGAKTGSAVLEVDGRALRAGTKEVNAAVASLLGMDYQAFFTSFFTGQKQLEFMAALEGRARAVAISRMLGYDRLTRARDQANQDKLGMQREIEGLERGLADPEELKERKKTAQGKLAEATKILDESETARKAAQETVDRLKPLKEASDQKARRQEEISRRLEIDRADVTRSEQRLNHLRIELADLRKKRDEFEVIRARLAGFKDVAEEYKKLAELSKHESERQRLGGQAAALEEDIKRLQASEKRLGGAGDLQVKMNAALGEAEALLADTDKKIQACREEKVALMHDLGARIKQLGSTRDEITAKRMRIAQAGADGKCPTCERELGDELDKVLANFDQQMREIGSQIGALKAEQQKAESEGSELESLMKTREALVGQIARLRSEKCAADGQVFELAGVRKDLAMKSALFGELQAELAKLPAGFDAARFRELEAVRESLQPERERAATLKGELERGPRVESEAAELGVHLDARKSEITGAERALLEIGFSAEAHEKLSREFEDASSKLSAVMIAVERQRGEVNTARAILGQIEREEESLKSRLEQVKEKRSERLHLETLAGAFDKLRAELNDRIRPELESIASELLAGMTDGRYNTLEINENYQAMIRDDGELKPVISGGEDDIVNLALRLAVSQMIADRAGQSFSLLVLDEVFGSLDDVRRDNVVALLQNLKNRFEQIIIITHVEAIHDAVDNCLWVEFDEKTKTSRLTDRSELFEPAAVGNPL